MHTSARTFTRARTTGGACITQKLLGKIRDVDENSSAIWRSIYTWLCDNKKILTDGSYFFLIPVLKDEGNDGKATSKSGLALNGISYCGKLRTVRSGGSWL